MQSSIPHLKSEKVFRTARHVASSDRGPFWAKFIKCADAGFQIGVIVTKKLGNAVIRNRIRRRIHNALNQAVKQGVIYPPSITLIVIAKKECKVIEFTKLVNAFLSVLLSNTRPNN